MNDVDIWRLLHSKSKELRTIAQRLGAGAQFENQLTGLVIEANQRRRVAEEEDREALIAKITEVAGPPTRRGPGANAAAALEVAKRMRRS